MIIFIHDVEGCKNNPNPMKELIMKKADLTKTREFDPKHMKKFLIHDSPYFRIINFNLAAGIVFPVHSHDLEGQLSIQVIEGEGEFLGKDDAAMSAKTGRYPDLRDSGTARRPCQDRYADCGDHCAAYLDSFAERVICP